MKKVMIRHLTDARLKYAVVPASPDEAEFLVATGQAEYVEEERRPAGPARAAAETPEQTQKHVVGAKAKLTQAQAEGLTKAKLSDLLTARGKDHDPDVLKADLVALVLESNPG